MMQQGISCSGLTLPSCTLQQRIHGRKIGGDAHGERVNLTPILTKSVFQIVFSQKIIPAL